MNFALKSGVVRASQFRDMREVSSIRISTFIDWAAKKNSQIQIEFRFPENFFKVTWSKVPTHSAYHSIRNIRNEIFRDPKSYQNNFSWIVRRIYLQAWIDTSRNNVYLLFLLHRQQQLCTIAFRPTCFNSLAAPVMDRRSILSPFNCSTNFATSGSIKELWVGQSGTHRTKKKLCELWQPFLCFYFRERFSEEKRKSFEECLI